MPFVSRGELLDTAAELAALEIDPLDDTAIRDRRVDDARAIAPALCRCGWPGRRRRVK